MSTGLLTSSRTKSKLYKKKLSKPTPQNVQIYKQYLNIYNRTRRALKINYYSHILEQSKNNMKQMWSVLKQAIGKQNNKSSLPDKFNINNMEISDKLEIANDFNKYLNRSNYRSKRTTDQYKIW